MNYTYEIEGSGADGNAWKTTGEVSGTPDPISALETAMYQTFEALTNGKAVYGKPGVGCSGPYTIRRVVMEKKQ